MLASILDTGGKTNGGKKKRKKEEEKNRETATNVAKRIKRRRLTLRRNRPMGDRDRPISLDRFTICIPVTGGSEGVGKR